ncbi:hypothetical protein AMTR_s00046p00195170 [Amborella trichopoda]|uniref:Rhamnogalacturonan lyase domain-containing protein n=1 Tax=Amborella trichopoda TaxID=13333 RepID=U5D6J1_AMBTC|nr:hypothetical protein AMTR_s00046p00195170 [Amborella trichopoda]
MATRPPIHIFQNAHYAGDDLVPKFRNGEPWKKVLGPVFIYLNSALTGLDCSVLWKEAKEQICQQQRHDCGAAYVGLALPGDAGSWQRECKGYQFWTKTDSEGYFTVNSVGIGDYNLYAWVYGFIGDYKYDDMITISAGECSCRIHN